MPLLFSIFMNAILYGLLCATLYVFNYMTLSLYYALPLFVQWSVLGTATASIVYIGMCIRKLYFDGFTFPLAAISLLLFLFPLLPALAAHLFSLSNGFLVRAIFGALQWGYLILYTILGAIPAAVGLLFHAVLSISPISSDIVDYISLGVGGALSIAEGWLIGRFLGEKLGND